MLLDLPAELPEDVSDFLEEGAAPVYVGLGSHTVPEVRETLAHTVAAALQLGHRAVVQRGSGLEETQHDDRVLFVDDDPILYAAFDWVSALVALVGAGFYLVAVGFIP